jgi:SLT domain-containing protein
VAGQQITFDFLSRGAASLSRDFRSIGDDSALSSRGVKVLSDVIERLGSKEDRTAAESKLLAGALRQTGDAADRATAKAVLADAAIRRLGDAEQDAAKKSDGLGKALGGLKLNPGLAGPAVALIPALATLTGVVAGAGIGLAGAFVAGGGALAAFGAVAKPVLTDAQKAAQAVQKAQDNYSIAIANGTRQSVAYRAEQVAIARAYANLSPAQIQLSQQLGAMAKSWDAVKTAQTPLVAGALQPWLKSVTDLTRNLAPIIAAVAPVIKGLGAQFDALVNSAAFRGFRDFIAGTGSRVVGAAGGTIIDLVKSFMILLPKFNPLILQMTGGIAAIGPAVLKWAGSQKTADQITAFMAWFKTSGPVVGDLLKNIGGTLKALAPGLTSGGLTELKVISDFFGLVAKLPPALAKPLADVAGVMLILNKLGVVNVGVKLLGMDAAAATAGGGAVGLWGKLLPGVRLAGGVLAATVAVAMILKSTPSGPGGKNWWDNPGGADPASKDPSRQGVSTWAGLANQIMRILDNLGKFIANTWATIWSNTVGGAVSDGKRLVSAISAAYNAVRVFITGSWDQTWAAVRGAVSTGLSFLAGSWQKLQGGVTGAWNAVRTFITTSWNQAWAATRNVTDAGLSFLAGSWQKLASGVTGAYNTVRSAIASAWNTIWTNTRNAVTTGISDVVRFFTGLPGKITAALGNLLTLLVQKGKDVIQGFWNGLTSIWTQVTSWIGGIASWIKAHKGPVSLDQQLLYPAGQALMSGFLGGLKAGFGPVGSFVGGIASWVLDKIKGAGGKLLGGKVVLDTSQFSSQALAGSVGGGVGRWAPLVRKALAMEHLNPNYILDVLYQMQTESGGNPNAINLTDTNAQHGDPSRGLMQVIMTTFRRWHWPGTSMNIYDPLANIAAALNYAAHGRGFGTGPGQIGSGHGYAYGTASALPGWAWVGERGPEMVRFRGGEQVIPAGQGGGIDALAGELRRIAAKLDRLTDVTAAVPAATGRHVGGAINGAGADAAFRRRYPGR